MCPHISEISLTEDKKLNPTLSRSFSLSVSPSLSKVCELDLQCNIDKVHHILNELVVGGLVLDTRLANVKSSISDLAAAEKGQGDSMANRGGHVSEGVAWISSFWS